MRNDRKNDTIPRFQMVFVVKYSLNSILTTKYKIPQ